MLLPLKERQEFNQILRRTLVVPILLIMVLAGVLLWQIRNLLRANRWAESTNQVISKAYVVENLLLDAETSIRGYLISDLPVFLEPYAASKEKLEPAIDNLIHLTNDSAEQTERLKIVKNLTKNWLQVSQKMIQLKADQGKTLAFSGAQPGKRIMDSIRERIVDFIHAEEILRAKRNEATRIATVTTVSTAIFITILFGVILSLFIYKELASLSARYLEAIQEEQTQSKALKESRTSLSLLNKELQKIQNSLEHRVEERTVELTAANQELEAFSFSVSHDLRAPLRAIDGFSMALQEDYGKDLCPEALNYLERIRGGAQKMSLLIDDLLRLSKFTQAELHLQRVNLSEIAKGIIAELSVADPDRKFQFICADEIYVEGDSGLLSIVLNNLIGNAWKYTSKLSESRIEFGVIQREGSDVYFIKDNGAGFNMAYADRLFGTFQRLHTHAEFSGSGIGLATVRRIIHRHHGRVWAEAQENQGATFYFEFHRKTLETENYLSSNLTT